MSSLQQALNNAANKFNLKKLGKRNSGGGDGAFENSFAHGLDISELISTETTPKGNDGEIGGDKRGSAAEELLRIKEAERRQRQIQEEEESKMQEALQKRLNSLKSHANSKEKERNQSAFEIGDALVRMHGTDEMAAVMLSQKANNRKGGSGGTANRRRNSSSRKMNRKTNKSSVAKKSRKSKF